ncbi:MAG: hypothetical protein OEM93_07165 [Rhodospirillales bacterium]|nr:hypothetical protein [Rhodospirillales bacterium]MDH3920812.1 hypothetical protein [Rhodospirillales bacterium]MDH3968283.1 hypothetical protein [Rhodospirillales bacterium]
MEPTPDTDASEAEENDAAWVVVETGLEAEELFGFCQDVERLFRINPAYVFRRWEDLGGGIVRWAALNESNDREIDTRFSVERLPHGLAVTYASGLKTRTTFRVEPGGGPGGGGAKLVVTDDYSGTPEAEREARVDEVDTSLNSWGYGLHKYLRQWRRWSGLAPWRWYMRRVWQPMRPMARRIVFLLIVITALEFVGFLLVFAIFRLNLEGYLGL